MCAPPTPTCPRQLVGVDEVAVRASGVVGTCAGGPVRFLLGSISTPSLLQPAAILAKVVLLCLPALAMGQWATHVVYLTKRIRRENERVNERPRKCDPRPACRPPPDRPSPPDRLALPDRLPTV